MQLISLNIWGGAVSDPLLAFLGKHSDVDFFLFQEMHDNATEKTNWDNRGNPRIFEDIKNVLPNHSAHFASAQDDEYGLAGFLSKKHELVEEGDIFVHRYKNAMGNMNAIDLGRNLQYFKIAGLKTFTLMNFHGLWTGGDKKDTESRLEQSKKIAAFAAKTRGEFILAGDFNLEPDTESIRILEAMNVRNLIRDFNITNTRTSFYTKPVKFADYTFVTPGITVRDFHIMPDEVSDHAAMFLEFDLA